jgi:hypothetical protein
MREIAFYRCRAKGRPDNVLHGIGRFGNQSAGRQLSMSIRVRTCVLCACACACAAVLAPAAAALAQPTTPTPTAPTPPSPALDPATPPAAEPAPAATTAAPAPAATEPAPAESAPERLFDTRIYGYLNSFLDRIAPATFERPLAYDRATGEVLKSQEPTAFNVDAFFMVQGTIGHRYRFFLNVAALGAGDPVGSTPIELRNAWVETSIYGQALAVRVGRMYRRFGLYNELLDATPTFIGIKEPEILDEDHLMITRTTNLMLLGAYVRGVHKVEYALTTGNDERADNQVPLGADLHYTYEDSLKIGLSYYDSMGKAKPGVKMGEGSPKGGVPNWMAEDEYRVVNAYAQLTTGPWIAQLEYALARHDARRDPVSTLRLSVASANLSPAQYGRFFTDPFDAMPPTEADVIERTRYTAQTAYFRLGHELLDGRLTPYLQLDYFKNPEIVPNEELGGDLEAGLDDRGRFWKGTLGVMYRPITPIALKLEYGSHLFMRWGGTSYVDPELRASLSYFWEL